MRYIAAIARRLLRAAVKGGAPRRRRSRRVSMGLSLAGFAALFVGATFGAVVAYSIGRGEAMSAQQSLALREDAPLPMRPATATANVRSAAEAAERLAAPMLTPFAAGQTAPPRIVLIFDDMGTDRRAFAGVMALPAKLTLSFLPYSDAAQDMAEEAKAEGHAIMLHLPMEATGDADPGPMPLKVSMRAGQLRRRIGWQLAGFDGYTAVNNHMGSRFTANLSGMEVVLEELAKRDLPFLDSLTTGASVATRAAANVGGEVWVRDVFLDDDPGVEAVRRQLAVAEQIAREKGFAIVIGHPRPETLAAVGPWVVTAPERGLELVTFDDLVTASRETNLAEAAESFRPALR